MAKPKRPLWRKSDAKKLLYYKIVQGEIPIEHGHRIIKQKGAKKGKRINPTALTPKQIFETHCKDHPAFADFNTYNDRFAPRLAALRDQVNSKYDRAEMDQEAFEHDRKIHPVELKNCRGVPRWEGHPAQALLKQHITAGIYPGLTPKQLHQHPNHLPYREFPLDVFRKHICQEIKERKFIQQYCNKDYYGFLLDEMFDEDQYDEGDGTDEDEVDEVEK